MSQLDRRTFLGMFPTIGMMLAGFRPRYLQEKDPIIMTVTGPVKATAVGHTLMHEHILVDFIGAKLITSDRWNRDEVADKVLPYLDQVRDAGCRTFVDCTPNYLGRDVVLLKRLSETAGINIITNTGYYGGSDHKFLPDHAFTESAGQLASRWTNEWKFGIDKTGIKPGFIKISVNPDTLSEISSKLVSAAILTHVRTGLTIASHTGPAVPALQQIEMIKKGRIDPSAFIWVHAQTEKDRSKYVEAAKAGAWISLDGLNETNVAEYVDVLTFLKEEKCLHRTLVSHDAGWFEPGKPDGGEFRGYTTLFNSLIPALLQNGFQTDDIRTLVEKNPANALRIQVRR